MKILCVIDSLGSGGAQRQLVGLAIGFKEKGHDVSILVYHNNNFFKKLLDEVKISVNAVIEPNYLKRLFKMRKYIRKGNYDAILSFLEAPNFICEIAGMPWRKWKLIVGERSANPEILTLFKLKAFRWFHLFADKIVANSHENVRLVKKINPILNNSKCKVIYNLVDLESWQPKSDYIFRKEGKLRIVVVASHQYLKNLNGLIEGVQLLSSSEKETLRIDWYGGVRLDDSKEASLEKINKYGLKNIFHFFEPIHEIGEKMNEADVVGLFSFYEGLPNVICEAMIIGKPIISSSVSDIPNILKFDSDCFFDPSNFNDISRVLSYILSLTEEKLLEIGARNKSLGSKLFNKNKIISEYLTLFD